MTILPALLTWRKGRTELGLRPCPRGPGATAAPGPHCCSGRAPCSVVTGWRTLAPSTFLGI